MRVSVFAGTLLGTIALLAIGGCAGGKQPEGILSEIDEQELAKHGITPFPQERVRIEVQQRVDDLRQSGADDRELESRVVDVTEDWQVIAKRLGQDVEFGEWECFAAGCTVVSRHAAAGALTLTLAEFAHSKAFLQWSAGKFQGAPLRSEDGRTKVTWILFAPRGDAPLADPDDRFDSFEPTPLKPSDAQEKPQ